MILEELLSPTARGSVIVGLVIALSSLSEFEDSCFTDLTTSGTLSSFSDF